METTLNTARIAKIVSSLMTDGIEPTFNNVLYKSLTTSGGTLTDENEVKAYLKENVFYFSDGLIFTDVENSAVYVDRKKFKVVPCFGFTYSFQKTQIKAAGGCEGFRRHVTEARVFGSLWHSTINNIIKTLKTSN